MTANPLADALLDFSEQMEPIWEFANGIRVRMEADGWSPTAAEKVATETLQGLIALLLTPKQSNTRGGSRG